MRFPDRRQLEIGMGDSDQELLRRFAQDSDESAFEALLQRHVDLVHSAALRQAGPDPQAASVTDSPTDPGSLSPFIDL